MHAIAEERGVQDPPPVQELGSHRRVHGPRLTRPTKMPCRAAEGLRAEPNSSHRATGCKGPKSSADMRLSNRLMTEPAST